MSATQTADQPAHSVSNITAHPGSSWAGVGLALLGTIQAGGVPTTSLGWVSLIAGGLSGLLAALGK